MASKSNYENNAADDPSGKSEPTTSPEAKSEANIIENGNAPARKVSLWNTINLFFGIMIGSGIFVSAIDLTKNLPNSGSVIAMWLFMGLYSLLGSISFAELGTCFPDSGGDFLYLKALSPKKVSDLVAFLRIFIELVVIRPGTHAIFGLTIGEYLIVPMMEPPQPAIAAQNISAFQFSCSSDQTGILYHNCTEITRNGGLTDCQSTLVSSSPDKVGIIEIPTVASCLPTDASLPLEYRCTSKETSSKTSSAIMWGQIACAVFLNLLFTYVNAYKVKLTQQLSAVLSIGKIIVLSTMILLGLYTIIFGETSKALVWGTDPDMMWDGTRWKNLSYSCILSNIVKASYAGQWAYAGWSDINYCMGEISNPSKNYPRAAMITLPMVTFLYTGIIICFYSVMTHTEFLCGITATASVFAEKALGFDVPNHYVRIFIGLSVSMATAGVLHSSIFSASRLFSAGVKFNHMPKVIGGIHKSHKTPIPSIFLLCLMSVIYCFAPLLETEGQSAIGFLVEATCFIYFLAIAICIVLLVRWRLRGRPNAGSVLDKIPVTTNSADNIHFNQTDLRKDSGGSEKLPLTAGITYRQEKTLDEVFILPIWMHLLYAFLSIAISVYMVYTDWETTLIGLVIILVGLPVYYIFIYEAEPLLEYLSCRMNNEDDDE